MKSYQRAIALGLSEVVLVGALAWWALPAPAPASIPAAPPEPWWTLAPLPAREGVSVAYQRLRERQPWGKEAATVVANADHPAANPSAETWRLVGIVRNGGERLALLASAGKISRYRAGDSLPSGARLLSVHSDYIEVEREGSRRIQRLYRPS